MSAAVRGMLGRFSIKGASCPLTYVTRVLCQHNLDSCVLKLTGSEGFFFSGSTSSAASHSPQILNYALHKLGFSSVSVITLSLDLFLFSIYDHTYTTTSGKKNKNKEGFKPCGTNGVGLSHPTQRTHIQLKHQLNVKKYTKENRRLTVANYS
jgi:hypothetical protein